MEEFLSVPSQDLLESCSREQSASAAEHFNLDVGGKRMKENLVWSGLLLWWTVLLCLAAAMQVRL